MDTEYYIQHIQCSREGKQECFFTVRQLVELALTAREKGLLAMEGVIRDYARFPDPFLRKAVNLVIDISNPSNIRRVLHNYIFTSNYTTNQRFLNAVLITETMLAVSQLEDLDYIFTYLVPSFFGMEYEEAVIDIYLEFKKDIRMAERLNEDDGDLIMNGSL